MLWLDGMVRGRTYSLPVGWPAHCGQTRMMLPLRQAFSGLLIAGDGRLVVEVNFFEEGRGKVWGCVWKERSWE